MVPKDLKASIKSSGVLEYGIFFTITVVCDSSYLGCAAFGAVKTFGCAGFLIELIESVL